MHSMPQITKYFLYKITLNRPQFFMTEYLTNFEKTRLEKVVVKKQLKGFIPTSHEQKLLLINFFLISRILVKQIIVDRLLEDEEFDEN